MKPIVYFSGNYFTDLKYLRAFVKAVLADDNEKTALAREHLLSLYRDGGLQEWLDVLAQTDSSAKVVAEALKKDYNYHLNDSDVKKRLASVFGFDKIEIGGLNVKKHLMLEKIFTIETPDNPNVEQRKLGEAVYTDCNRIAILLTFKTLASVIETVTVKMQDNEYTIPLHKPNESYTLRFDLNLENSVSDVFQLIVGERVFQEFEISCVDYVDMGRGVLWAKKNVLAKNPEDPGGYFAWGAVKQGINKPAKSFGIRGRVEYDCATACMGEKWWMPTAKEWMDLLEDCSKELIATEYGKALRLTSKKNMNRLIIPCGGFYADGCTLLDKEECNYWTSTRVSDSAWTASYDSPAVPLKIQIKWLNRCLLNVRAVRRK